MPPPVQKTISDLPELVAACCVAPAARRRSTSARLNPSTDRPTSKKFRRLTPLQSRSRPAKIRNITTALFSSVLSCVLSMIVHEFIRKHQGPQQGTVRVLRVRLGFEEPERDRQFLFPGRSAKG